MDWNQLLTSEAIASYVVFVFGVIFGVIGFFAARWLSRQRPKKVKLLKNAETSLIRVGPEVANEITLTYKGKTVKSLYLTTFILQNVSDEIIDDVNVAIEFDDTEVIDVIINDPVPSRASSAKKMNTESTLEIIVPFFNPHKLYKDRVELSVFALSPIKVKRVVGGGRGWNVEFFDRVQFINEVFEEVVSVNSFNLLVNLRVLFRLLESLRRY